MHNTFSFSVNDRAQLDKIAAAIAIAAPYALPIYQAARDGLITIAQPTRGAQISRKLLYDAERPVLALLGDDDYTASGPQGWACAWRVKAWAQGGIIHAAGGEVGHYRAALTATLAAKRFVLVETDSAHEAAWRQFLCPKMALFCIRARPDSPHPMKPSSCEVN